MPWRANKRCPIEFCHGEQANRAEPVIVLPKCGVEEAKGSGSGCTGGVVLGAAPHTTSSLPLKLNLVFRWFGGGIVLVVGELPTIIHTKYRKTGPCRGSFFTPVKEHWHGSGIQYLLLSFGAISLQPPSSDEHPHNIRHSASSLSPG